MGSLFAEKALEDYSILIGNGLIILIQSATLVRVQKGSRHRFVIKILAMLICYNLAMLANEIVYLDRTLYGTPNCAKEAC